MYCMACVAQLAKETMRSRRNPEGLAVLLQDSDQSIEVRFDLRLGQDEVSGTGVEASPLTIHWPQQAVCAMQGRQH